MGRFHCDRCGKGLLVDDEEARYEVRIEVKAGFDPPELTRRDLARDHRGEIRRLLRAMEGMDPTRLEEQVFLTRTYDLCGRCREEWVADPLGSL